TDFLKANKGPLTRTFANLESISTQISQGQGTVGRLIYDDALYNSALTTITNLQETGADVKLALGDARKAINQVNLTIGEINAGHGTIGKLVKDETIYNNLADASGSLKEILEK